MQIVSALRGVGEAVKGKNEKWLTGVRYAHARDGTLHPRGGDDPPAERKNWGAETENAQLFDLTRRGGNKGRGARQTTVGRCKKKRARCGGIAEDFVTLLRKRDTPPSGADFRPHRSDRPPQCDETLPPRLSP